MTIENADDLDIRYVTTYSQGGLEGYLVKIPWYPVKTRRVDRRYHSKLFAFSRFPSKRAAIESALAYRDDWFSKHSNQLHLRPIGARFNIVLPKNNTSGILGVGRTERLGRSGIVEAQWQTTYRDIAGKVANRKFAVGKYGEIGALRKAVGARRDGLLQQVSVLSDENVDESVDAIGFYDDILENLRDYSDSDETSPLIEIVKSLDIPATSKLEQILVRVGQERFRREVLAFFDNSCAVTGATILIRASHIKPWRIASDQERLDPANGLALSPVYDAAFDLGLISFRQDGTVLVSDRLASDAEQLGISGNEHLRALSDAHLPYLEWHRGHMYLGNDG